MCFIMYGWQRATTTHARPHPAVFVSFRLVRRKIYFFTSVGIVKTRVASASASERAAAQHPPRVVYKRTRRVFRTIGFFSVLSLSFSNFFSFLVFSDRRPQTIWILIEKLRFMLLCDDRDCSRARILLSAHAIIHAKYNALLC